MYMNELKKYEPKEHYSKLGTSLERFKATNYIKKINREIEYCKSEQSALEARLTFLYNELETALHYKLMH